MLDQIFTPELLVWGCVIITGVLSLMYFVAVAGFSMGVEQGLRRKAVLVLAWFVGLLVTASVPGSILFGYSYLQDMLQISLRGSVLFPGAYLGALLLSIVFWLLFGSNFSKETR